VAAVCVLQCSGVRRRGNCPALSLATAQLQQQQQVGAGAPLFIDRRVPPATSCLMTASSDACSTAMQSTIARPVPTVVLVIFEMLTV